MPSLKPLVAAALVGATLGAAGLWVALHQPAPSPPPPALLALEGMGHLVSVKVRYANVIEFTQQLTQGIPWTQWELRLGGTQVLLVAKGDCLVGSDMRQARYEAVDPAARTATLLLPPPAVVSARVHHGPRDQGGSYFYAVQGTGIEPLIPGSANRTQAIDTALQRAQQDMERACQSASTLATAKENAEAVLKPLFAATGWAVQVRWQP
ncbi:DUF4230 domain-containing protein [Acidovorax sp.]|uniref:DUF4230 domain-containing protein n=1 Tax=Acidovorax sp. TaxID=1872122 RepID=UPI002637448C|nr:DUF4230 domain-containing protein [Acidovorax sp.]